MKEPQLDKMAKGIVMVIVLLLILMIGNTALMIVLDFAENPGQSARDVLLWTVLVGCASLAAAHKAMNKKEE